MNTTFSRSQRLIILAFATLSLVSFRSSGLAADGDLDPTFDPADGITLNTNVVTTAVQPDGKILIGGSFSQYRGAPRSGIARINPNGTVDPTFNPGAGADARVISLALQADGKIVIVGDFENYNGVPRHAVARVNSDGSLDASFDPGAGPDYGASATPPHAVVVQPDGKIIIGGGFLSYNGVPRRGVARLNANGSLDTSFDQPNAADGQVYALALAPDGKIVAGGHLFESAGVERFYVTRLNPNGSLDTSFDPAREIEGDVRTLAVQGDGKVLVGGFGGLVRLNGNGSTDTSFKKDEFVVLYSCVVAADGKIIIGGVFSRYNETAVNNIARLAADGTVDTSFNAGGEGPNTAVFAMTFQSDGKLIIGGAFTEYNGATRRHIARLFSSGGGTPTPTPSRSAPKGKLGTTFFGARQFGNVMQFTSLVIDAAASFSVRVQASTTPDNESSWQDIPNGFSGRMIRDYSYEGSRAYSLNSTHYPQQNGVHFRAVASAAGYPDSISDADGPFDLASDAPRAGTVLFRIPELIVTPNAFIRFIADVNNRAPDTTVRVQSSSTPGDEGSWTDVTSLPFRANSDDYRLRTDEYPTGDSIYFRAVASAPGRVDSLSNIVGDFELQRVPAPTIQITSPQPSGGGSGASEDDPIVIGEGQRYPIFFDFAATASASASAPIKVIRLIYDGITVHRTEGRPDAALRYTTSVPGDHTLRALTLTSEYALTATQKLHIRIAPDGGRVFRCLGGDWNNANTWRDGAGNPGVPGPKDHAIVRNVDVSLSSSSTVAAVTLNGGSIAGPGELTITGHFKLGPSQLRNVALIVERGGTFSLTSDTDVPFTGRLINRGTFVSEGRGNIVGVPTGGGTSEFARLNNQGDFFLQGGGTLTFANGSTDSGRIAPLPLIGNDGSGVINQDGSGVINQDGSGVINQDGSGFVSRAGILSEQVGGFVSANGSIITHDGSSFVSNDSGTFVSNNGATFVSTDGGSLVFRSASGALATRSGAKAKAAEGGPGFLKTAGEIDFGSPTSTTISIVGDVTMEGGVLTGTGALFGNLQHNGGFISPGSSAGAIGVTGDYTQGPDATLVAEVGGPHSRQFDQLVVGGTANVNGKLTLRAINGYVPEADGTFSPLAYGSGSGSFTTSDNAQMTLGATGLLGTLNPNVPPPPPAKLLNIATRLRVEQGDDALIAGFIITGSAPKRVIVRAIGPSLTAQGINGALSDPTLELFRPGGSTFNNNWRDTQEGEIAGTTLNPGDEREAAIVATLDPGVAYTAVVRGFNASTGVGLVEVYDLESAAPSTLANISTRGLVQTGENVMIGGLIIGGDQPAKVLVRAIGPSLGEQGVAGALEDPILALNDANGNAISNDDWRETQEEEIVATTVFPTNPRESAIVATLTPGNYTAIIRGKGDTTGVALVEAYNIQ